MAIIIRPGRWNTQPPPGSQINFGHPLTRGLQFHLLYNQGGGLQLSTLPLNLKPTIVGSIPSKSWGNGPGGSSQNWDGNWSMWFERGAYCEPNWLTMVSRGRRVGVTLAQSAGLLGKTSHNGASAPFISYGIVCNPGGGNDDQFLCQFADNTQTLRSGPTISPGTLLNVFTLGVTVGPNGSSADLKSYFNGIIQDTTNFGSVTGIGYDQTSTGRLIASGNNASSVSNAWKGDIYYSAIWGRPLTSSEMEWLHFEPYAFFTPRIYRKFFLSSGTPLVNKSHNLDVYIQAFSGYSHNIDAYIVIPFTDRSHSIDAYLQGAAVAREFVQESSNLIPPITNPNAFVRSRTTLATPARDFIQSAVTLRVAAIDFVDAAVSLAQRASGYVKAAVTLSRGASPSHNIDVLISSQPLSFVKSAVSLTQKLIPTGCQGSFPDISFVKAEVWLVQPGDHSRQAPGTALTTTDDWLSQVDANNAYSVVARFVLAGIPLIVTGFSSGVISWQTRTRQWLRLVDFEPGGVVLSTRTSTRKLPNGQIITTTTKITQIQDTTVTEVTTVNSATPNRVSRSVTELSKGGHRVTRSIETDTINGVRTTTEKKIVDAEAAPSKDNIQPIKVTTLDGVQHYQFFATANSPAWAGGDAEGTTSTVTAVSVSGQTRTTDQTVSTPDGKIINIHTDETGLRNTGTTTTDTQENFQGIQTTTVKTVSFPDGSQEVTTTTTNNITGDSTETTVETATDENGLTTTTTTVIETVTFQDPITSNLRTTITKTVTIQGPTGTTVDTVTEVRNNFEDDLLANKIKVYLIQEFTLNCVIDRFSKEALEEIAIDHQKNFAIAELIGQQLGNMDLSWTLRQNLINQLNQAINCIDPVQLQALGKTYGVVFAPSASSFRAKYIPGTLPAVFELQMIVQARSDLVTGLKGL